MLETSGWSSTTSRADQPQSDGEGSRVVVALHLSGDKPKHLQDLTDSTNDPVLVVVQEHDLMLYRGLMQLGITGILNLETSGPELSAAIECAYHGYFVLKLDDVGTFGEIDSPSTTHPYGISSIETKWLQSLGNGRTVAQVALDAGYSERSFYRVLQKIYLGLGVNNRSEALELANRIDLFNL
jgi:DNA-binding NarL/FixJ family response regulator